MPTKPVILDSGPLGQLCNPSPRRHLEIKLWFATLRALELLDDLNTRATLLAPSAGVYQGAAGLWAQARRLGRSTSHPLDLDVDVIVAALAIETGAIVATDNVAHFARFVDARPWSAITPATLRA